MCYRLIGRRKLAGSVIRGLLLEFVRRTDPAGRAKCRNARANYNWSSALMRTDNSESLRKGIFFCVKTAMLLAVLRDSAMRSRKKRRIIRESFAIAQWRVTPAESCRARHPRGSGGDGGCQRPVDDQDREKVRAMFGPSASW